MKTITSTEARQHFSSIISTLEEESVTILKQDKSVAVILSSARYRELERLVHILAQPEHPFCSNLNTYSETS